MDAQSFGEALEAMFLLIFWGFVVLCVVCFVAVGGCTYFMFRDPASKHTPTANTAPLSPAAASQDGLLAEPPGA